MVQSAPRNLTLRVPAEKAERRQAELHDPESSRLRSRIGVSALDIHIESGYIGRTSRVIEYVKLDGIRPREKSSVGGVEDKAGERLKLTWEVRYNSIRPGAVNTNFSAIDNDVPIVVGLSMREPIDNLG